MLSPAQQAVARRARPSGRSLHRERPREGTYTGRVQNAAGECDAVRAVIAPAQASEANGKAGSVTLPRADRTELISTTLR
jgi:hypothetical protein